jgi:hypothetical protein
MEGGGMNFRNEERMRRQLLKDSEKMEIHLINMGKGTFDLLLDAKTPRIIELKMAGHSFQINVGDSYGFEFDKRKTKELRKMQNKDLIPFVIACDREIEDEKRFYFITAERLEKAMHAANRDDFEKIIFNRVERDHLFKKKERLTWELILKRLRELASY